MMGEPVEQLIESLKTNLHRLLKWQFGPKSEGLAVDQFGLFADGSLVIEVPAPERDSDSRKLASTAPPAERRRAVRVLKHLPRVIERVDVREEQKTCPCCGERMSPFGHESSEQLHYVPAKLEVHETQRLKYSCSHCHGAAVRDTRRRPHQSAAEDYERVATMPSRPALGSRSVAGAVRDVRAAYSTAMAITSAGRLVRSLLADRDVAWVPTTNLSARNAASPQRSAAVQTGDSRRLQTPDSADRAEKSSMC